MSYPKLKSENYSNFGGVNIKSSQYITDQTQFLRIENMNFMNYGALTKDWGCTQYATGVTQPLTGIGELTFLGSTLVLGGFTSATFSDPFFETFGSYTFATQASYIYGVTNLDIYTGTKNVFYLDPQGVTNIYQYLFNRFNSSFSIDTQFDFLGLQNLFFCDSSEFLQLQGQGPTVYPWSLPAPQFQNGFQLTVGNSNGTQFDLNRTYEFVYRFIRSDGFQGPLAFTQFNPFTVSGLSHRASFSVRMVPSIPQLFAIYGGGQSVILEGSTAPYWGASGMYAWLSVDGGTFLNYNGILGFTTNIGVDASFSLWGGSLQLDTETSENFLGSFMFPETAASGQLMSTPNPSCIEAFNNQMFFAGFVEPNEFYTASTVVYSKIGEYEEVDPEGNFEVRPNDGDIVTCLKAYFTELVIFKRFTTFSLRGDNPDNFNLSAATLLYGCLNNNACCVWEQKLWFLDTKGICEYNGANTTIVSSPVEPIFQRMNLNTAIKYSSMIHVKEKNEVWCFIPTDDNIYCDTIVIYDYVANAWRTRPNSRRISTSSTTKGIYEKEKPFIGTYSGMAYAFNSDYLQDNGTGFTCLAKSRFIATELGHSVEKQFRRFYLDANIEGASVPILINFYADHGTMPVYSQTMILDNFQNRIDFGIPAKDLAVEMVYGGDTLLQINGFTIEYRFQRAT